MGAPGVLIKPLQDEFGWETSQISSALAIRLILFGLMGPFAAAFMNRFGVRKVIVFARAQDAEAFYEAFANAAERATLRLLS